MTHCLDKWKPYLIGEDYDYLIQYVENIKHNVSNDKMIILSGIERTGKTSLKNDIKMYLGDDFCGDLMMSGDIIYNENIKRLRFFCGIHEIFRSKKNITAIVNLIKYKQSFLSDTTNIEKVNNNLLEYSKIIKMEHVF